MNKDIEQALTDIRANAARYDKTTRYYDGDHDLAFATEKFQNTFGTLFREFALNLCPVICDAVRDKLRVTGFSVEDARRTAGSLPASRNAEDTQAGSLRSDSRRIWQRNRMATRAGEIHKEALKNGDAFAIVWPNAAGEAVIYPNRAANITVAYDDDAPGRICRVYQGRRDVLLEGLNRAGWRLEPPKASMFVWAPIPERFHNLGAMEFSKRLLTEAHVAVAPGVGFGEEGEGFVRIALVENEQRLRQAARGVKKMLSA